MKNNLSLCLLIVPFAIRTFLGIILGGHKSYSAVVPEYIILDPSIIAFFVVTIIIVPITVSQISSFLELFLPPLILFVFYGIIGTIFGLFTKYKLLALFIGYELFIYYLIAAISIKTIKDNGSNSLLSVEKFFFSFLLLLIFIAIIDLLLPNTQPFSIEVSGRKRFDGSILRLVSIQWSAIFSMVFLFSFSNIFRKYSSKNFYSILSIVSFAMLALCGSRGAILASVLSFLYLLFFFRKRVNLFSWIVILLLTLLLITSSFLLNSQIVLNVLESLLRISNKENVLTFGGRLKLWNDVIVEILSNPFQGYGIGTRGARPSILTHSMHNFILEAWVSTGLAGLIFFCSGLIVVGKKLWIYSVKLSQKISNDNIKNYELVVLTSASIFLYLLLHGIVESNIAGTNNIFSVALIYCIIIAQSIKRND